MHWMLSGSWMWRWRKTQSIGLTHNISSWAADGNAETDSGGGLTSFGVRLVEEMNTLGILVDVSHISEPGFWDVMKVSQRPVIASHSNCRAVCDHPRNLSAGQIQALAENGGAMGVTFVPSFVSDTSPSIDDLFLHIDHAIQLGGPDHVGIGSDFDGEALWARTPQCSLNSPCSCANVDIAMRTFERSWARTTSG